MHCTPMGARPATSRRLRRVARVALPSIAAAAVTAAGYAAFVDQAGNDGNQATAASVAITQDVGATTPLFDLTDWQPQEADTVARCISVRNEGSIALPLSLRFKGAPSGELGRYVDMTIVRGTRDAASSTSDCSSFRTDGADATVYDGLLGDFPTAAGGAIADKGGRLGVGASRAYRITWHLHDDDAAQGKSISGVNFLWETTSAD